MTTPPDGGPAFPRFTSSSTMDGMSLRAYIATAALQGMLAGPTWQPNDAEPELSGTQRYAKQAVLLADALIAELNKPTK